MGKLGFELKYTRSPFLYEPAVDYSEPAFYLLGDEEEEDTDFRYRAEVNVTTHCAYSDGYDDARSYRLNRPHIAIYMWRYPVLKRTPKGAWIEPDGERRFVLDGPGKRWAHETRALALESLKLRMRRRLAILATQLEDTELAIYGLANMKEG